jgi:Flp pilus assembly protein protease CpaA
MQNEEISTQCDSARVPGRIKLKTLLPYTGIPLIGAALILLRAGQADVFLILLYLTLIIFGYFVAIVDIKDKRIPNGLVLAMLSAWVLIMTPKLLLDTGAAVEYLIGSTLGFAIGGGLFFLIYLISRKGLGGGDVKFMAAAGLYLRFDGVLTAMLYGSVFAALTGLTLMMFKKIGRKDMIPLAPFLYAGILIAVFS